MDEKQPTISHQVTSARLVQSPSGPRMRVAISDSKGHVVGHVDLPTAETKGSAKRSRVGRFFGDEKTAKVKLPRAKSRLLSRYAEPVRRNKTGTATEKIKTYRLTHAIRAGYLGALAPAPRHERSAVTDFQAEAERLTLPLEAASSDREARARLRVIAADASDIFATPAAAIKYLTTKPLDGKGRNGVQILREKGLPGVIAGLDHLRFGSRG